MADNDEPITRSTIESAAWARELVEALREAERDIELAKAVAKGPAKPRMQNAIDSVRKVRRLLAMGAKFTAEVSGD